MSKDPAFLFYDGDAAKDVSHMNRLERGAYFDLIQAQRKFGNMSIDLIKKVLGKDFDSVWDSIKIILTYDNHMYYINWLQESINKRETYCKSRQENRMKGKINRLTQTTYVEHMVNENENEIINRISIQERGTGETDFDTFKKAYPLNGCPGSINSQKAFYRALSRGNTGSSIVQAARDYAAHLKMKHPEITQNNYPMLANAENWLDGDRFLKNWKIEPLNRSNRPEMGTHVWDGEMGTHVFDGRG